MGKATYEQNFRNFGHARKGITQNLFSASTYSELLGDVWDGSRVKEIKDTCKYTAHENMYAYMLQANGTMHKSAVECINYARI